MMAQFAIHSLGSVRWGVAMTIPLAAVAGLVIGIALGAIIAGLVLMERPRRWVVCLACPKSFIVG